MLAKIWGIMVVIVLTSILWVLSFYILIAVFELEFGL